MNFSFMPGRQLANRKWLAGAMLGPTIWVLFYVAARMFAAANSYMDSWTWLGRWDFLLTLLTTPIPLLGWFYLWGDLGPPYWWINEMPFNVAIGLFAYSVVGAVVGAIVGYLQRLSRKRRRLTAARESSIP